MKKNIDGVPKRKSGQPKKFETKEQFIEAFKEFLTFVIDNDFEILPSQLRFCLWYEKNYTSVDPRTIWNTANKYFPTIKKEMSDMIADMLVEGGAKGKYVSPMAIFALKNWCGWSDKPQSDDSEKLDNIAETLVQIKEVALHDRDKP